MKEKTTFHTTLNTSITNLRSLTPAPIGRRVYSVRLQLCVCNVNLLFPKTEIFRTVNNGGFLVPVDTFIKIKIPKWTSEDYKVLHSCDKAHRYVKKQN